MEMDLQKNKDSIRVAKLYYEDSLSQEAIAQKLNISRPTVSRLLNHAKEHGFVKVTIEDPYQDAESLASLLKAKYQLKDYIGISWGKTMYQVSQFLQSTHLKDIGVIQLKGGISFSHIDTRSHQILERFAQAYNATPRDLPLPVIFDVKEVKQMVEKDRHI